MGLGSAFRKFGRQFEDMSRRGAKYTFAAGGAMMGGPSGARAGYEFGSMFDDRKPQARQTGTDLSKLRSDAVANGFNPLTVLRATGGQGFYKNEIPMGRLSSDAFFNTFDAIESKNNFVIENDPYIGYNDTSNKVPVKYLNKEFVIPLSMARHMKVLPNQSLNAGLMAEIFGEVSEVTNAFSLGGQQNTYGIDFLGFGRNQGKSILEANPYYMGYKYANTLYDDAIEVLRKNVNQPPKLSSDAADNRVNFINKLGGALSTVGDFFTRNQGIPIKEALSLDTIPNWYKRRN